MNKFTVDLFSFAELSDVVQNEIIENNRYVNNEKKGI